MDEKKLEKKQAHTASGGNHAFAFGKTNFVLLAAGVVVVLVGLFMMAGGHSEGTVFDQSIFSTTRIKVAPVVTLIGFVSIIFAIMVKPKEGGDAMPKSANKEA